LLKPQPATTIEAAIQTRVPDSRRKRSEPRGKADAPSLVAAAVIAVR
jgi:hypothetical protein